MNDEQAKWIGDGLEMVVGVLGMLEQGVDVSYEAIRLWCLSIRRQLCEEVAAPTRIARRHVASRRGLLQDQRRSGVHLWRAVDQSGEVLDVLVQKRRNGKAARRFSRNLRKGRRYEPSAIVTDKLARYASAKKDLMPGVAHHRGRGLMDAGVPQSNIDGWAVRVLV